MFKLQLTTCKLQLSSCKLQLSTCNLQFLLTCDINHSSLIPITGWPGRQDSRHHGTDHGGLRRADLQLRLQRDGPAGQNLGPVDCRAHPGHQGGGRDTVRLRPTGKAPIS